MSTLGGRHAARQERYVGVVRAGMRADLATSRVIRTGRRPPRARCVATLVQGRVATARLRCPTRPVWYEARSIPSTAPGGHDGRPDVHR
jgi:hypothetical protein